MSNLNLIGTQTDNQQYDIVTIAKNLQWVLPSNIVNSSPATPITWKQYNNFKNLATSCIANQRVSTQTGSQPGCNLLYYEIIAVNPNAQPVDIPSPTPVTEPEKTQDETPEEEEEEEKPSAPDDNSIYIYLGIMIIVVICFVGVTYFYRKNNNSNNSNNFYVSNDITDENPTELAGGYFNRGE
jgi:hypothetical protein